jgi:hypothetical protein
MSPEEFVAEFDRLFLIEKHRIAEEQSRFRYSSRKPEPYSTDFGVASAVMNRQLRALMKDPENPKDEPEESKNLRVRLKWAYAYWWNRLHLLESMAASRLGDMRTKKNIKKGGIVLKKLIAGETSIEKLHPDFLRMIEQLNRMQVEKAGFVKQSGELLKGGL